MLKAVIFDLDDTLLWDDKSVSEAFKATCEKATEKYAIDLETLEENVRKHAQEIYPTLPTYPFTSNIGIGTFEGMWGTFSDESDDFKLMRDTLPTFRKEAWFNGLKDLDIVDEALASELAVMFPAERKKHIFLYEETIDILEQLQGEYKLIMLTNGAPSLQHTKLSLSPQLAPFFDHIIISGNFGQGKPSVDIFKHVLHVAGVDKNEAVMIGDNPMTDILGASRVGMDSIWINHHKRDLTEVTPTYEVKRLKEIMPIIKSLSK